MAEKVKAVILKAECLQELRGMSKRELGGLMFELIDLAAGKEVMCLDPAWVEENVVFVGKAEDEHEY